MDDPKVLEIVDRIYKLYGTGTGCLFGLHADQRSITEAIVKATLNVQKEDE